MLTASERMEKCYHHSSTFGSPQKVGVPENYIEDFADGCAMVDIDLCTNNSVVSAHEDRALTKGVPGVYIDDPAKLCDGCRKYRTRGPKGKVPFKDRVWDVNLSASSV